MYLFSIAIKGAKLKRTINLETACKRGLILLASFSLRLALEKQEFIGLFGTSRLTSRVVVKAVREKKKTKIFSFLLSRFF